MTRRGVQLLELIISMSAASILLAGIFTSIRLTTQANDNAIEISDQSALNNLGLARLAIDIEEGYPITNRTTNTFTTSVADRNGDGARESIAYRWQGVGNALERSQNGGSWESITEPLSKFGIQSIDGVPAKESNNESLQPAERMEFEGHTVKSGSSSQSLSIGVPATFQPGDLLVLAFAADIDVKKKAAVDASWTEVFEKNKGSHVSLVVWYTLTPATNTVEITWDKDANSYATIAHYRVNSGTPVLAAHDDSTGNHDAPECPAMSCSTDNTLAIRLMAGDGPLVGEDATYMPGHAAITMRRSILRNPIIGLASRSYPAGAIDAASFGLSSSAQHVAATLVFEPGP